MKINIAKVRSNAILPEYQTSGAAGADLHACLDEPVVIQPLERKLIPTGISMEIPEGYEVQIRARSGLSIKYGISIVNGIGTIDADYRGEFGVLLINFGQEPFTVEPDMRIAQIVVAKYDVAQWNEVKTLDETSRGVGGFGSSGIK